MTSRDEITAVMVARGVSGGSCQRRAFLERERVFCGFVREARQWRCVLTHLSRRKEPDA